MAFQKSIMSVMAMVAMLQLIGCARVDVNPNYPRTGFPAIYMKAWNVAYDDFIRIEEMPQEQKDLSIYRIELGREGGCYTVQFISELVPINHKPPLHRMTLGRSMKYWIDIKTMKIEKRLFSPD